MLGEQAVQADEEGVTAASGEVGRGEAGVVGGHRQHRPRPLPLGVLETEPEPVKARLRRLP
jgi:hypothetical protein